MTPEEANREIELLRQDLENTRQAKNHEIIELKHALSRAEIRIVYLSATRKTSKRDALSCRPRKGPSLKNIGSLNSIPKNDPVLSPKRTIA